jgi:hypothetical protein
MATVWSDNTINRFAQAVEEEISSSLNVILDRWAIPIQVGIYDYQIPNYITSFRRVTWIGYELNPRSRQDQISSATTPFLTTESMPREYLISGMGFNTIRLLPTPNISLSYTTGDLWLPVNYMNACVIEFSRRAEITDPTMRIPEFLRRLFFRDAILARCLSQEGQGQDLKGADYFTKKSKVMLKLLTEIKDNLWLYCPKSMSPDPSKTPHISHPVLPPNFPARG